MQLGVGCCVSAITHGAACAAITMRATWGDVLSDVASVYNAVGPSTVLPNISRVGLIYRHSRCWAAVLRGFRAAQAAAVNFGKESWVLGVRGEC